MNIRSGGSSRVSTVTCAVSTAVMAAALLQFFDYLPLPIVASLLFQVAVGMVEPNHLKHSFHVDRPQFYLTMLVAIVCVFLDPTFGIIIGTFAALIHHGDRTANPYAETITTDNLHDGKNSNLRSLLDSASLNPLGWFASIKAVFLPDPKKRNTHNVDVEDMPNGAAAHQETTQVMPHTVIYRIVGDMTFLSAMSHCERLRNLTSRKSVIISLRYTTVVDLDGIDQLGEVIDELRHHRRQTVLLCNMAEEVQKKFKLVSWFRNLKDDGLLFDQTRDAVQYLQGLSEDAGPRDVAAADVAHMESLKLQEQLETSLNLAKEN